MDLDLFNNIENDEYGSISSAILLRCSTTTALNILTCMGALYLRHMLPNIVIGKLTRTSSCFPVSSIFDVNSRNHNNMHDQFFIE